MMNLKKNLLLGVITLFFVPVSAQTKMTPKEAAVKIADRILNSTTCEFKNKKTGEVYKSLKNVPLTTDVKVESKYNDWHYTNGVTNIALLELADKIGDKKYDEYVLKNMNFVFNEGNLDYFRKLYDKTLKERGWKAVREVNWHMIFRGKRLDDNGPMGASLIELQKRHPNKSFLNYIDQTADHLNYAEPRLADGTIARLWPHVNTIWADDAFMAISFLSRMGTMTGDEKYFTDAANQILNYTKYLWCPEKNIYYHCYHTDNNEHGAAHWSRANGWVFMAQADLLSRMPKNHPLRDAVIKNFQQQASGVARYQGKNGLWHQLLDKEDSFEEITGTAMFVFGIARGVKEGWLHPDFIYVAEQGLKGMMKLITDNGDVTGICVGTGIMPAITYYYNRPTQENDPMGEGPVLRALVEMIDAPVYTEIKAEQQYDKIVVKK
nr:glycoside hydrolase family 88 protein [uncultured Bacteroides sp.]